MSHRNKEIGDNTSKVGFSVKFTQRKYLSKDYGLIEVNMCSLNYCVNDLRSTGKTC